MPDNPENEVRSIVGRINDAWAHVVGTGFSSLSPAIVKNLQAAAILAAGLALTVPAPAAAQSATAAEAQERTQSKQESRASVVVSAQALLAYQPDDDLYATGSCGQPATYLNCGPGGIGPGIAGGVHYRRAVFIVGVEASAARFSARQQGRIARGGATATLIDTLVSAVAGMTQTYGNNRFRLVAGGTRVFTSARQRFSDGSIYDPGDWLRHEPSYTLTAGVDMVRQLSDRDRLVVSVRYTPLPRSDSYQQIGLGAHTLRVGVGLGYRVNP